MGELGQFFADHFSWIDDPAVVSRQLLVGLSNAGLLFLISAGLTLIFGVSRIINFAHGLFYMLGAYAAFSVAQRVDNTDLAFLLALVVGPLALAVAGAACESLLLRRLSQTEHIYQLLLTFALVLIGVELVKLQWGTQSQTVSVPDIIQGVVRRDGFVFPYYRLAVTAAAGLAAVAMFLLLRTRWGMAVRAAALDREMVEAMGIDTRLLSSQVFALGSALAGLAGVLAAPVTAIDPGLQATVLADCFIVAVVGGLGSVTGALAVSVLLGQTYSFGTLSFPDLAVAVPFAVMAAVLVVRPWGLLGARE